MQKYIILGHENPDVDSIVSGYIYQNYLRRRNIDADFIIPLNTVVMATRIINPILDKMDIELDNYMLDVYAKEKGDVTNE